MRAWSILICQVPGPGLSASSMQHCTPRTARFKQFILL
uniref:Uncharacterized protein n=1 Tax=Arundo donax TaxID=35708 RepID=A0A0A9AQR9_ARUDO